MKWRWAQRTKERGGARHNQNHMLYEILKNRQNIISFQNLRGINWLDTKNIGTDKDMEQMGL